jgi:hypothetical protein
VAGGAGGEGGGGGAARTGHRQCRAQGTRGASKFFHFKTTLRHLKWTASQLGIAGGLKQGCAIVFDGRQVIESFAMVSVMVSGD